VNLFIDTGGGAAATPILDTYPGAVAAYSTSRKLKTGVTYAMKVRNAANTVSTDIGFDGSGNIDSAALSSAAGGADLFVEILYDQSGNSYDLTQATHSARPLIVDDGALFTDGGRAAMTNGSNWLTSAGGAGANFGTAAGLSGNPNLSVFVVARKTSNSSGYLYGWGDTGSALAAHGLYDDGSTALIAHAGGHSKPISVPTNNTHYVHSIIHPAGPISGITVKRNGVSVITGAGSGSNPNIAGNQPLIFGGWANLGSPFSGREQEMLIYAADKTSDEAAIVAEIQTYYGI
jgi:hypothetical protein